KRVLEGVDLAVPRGGFLLVTGPNGSGKTTLLRLCAGLAAPTAGELEVDAARGAIGFLAHEPLVYRELTALENLDLYGRLYRERAPRLRMRRYLQDTLVLARKDLLLELRARDTIPAMLLFVIAAFVTFHFALPAQSSELAAKGLLWVALVFTALLGLTRAFVAERDQRLLDGLLLAPCDRSAIWLAKGIAVVAFLGIAELVALP